MAITEIDRKRIETWCDGRIPARLRDQIQVVAAFRGNSAAIIETRPPWREDFGPEWTRIRIAKLVFDPTANT